MSLYLNGFGDWRKSAQQKLHSRLGGSFQRRERQSMCPSSLVLDKGGEDSGPHNMFERIFQ